MAESLTLKFKQYYLRFFFFHHCRVSLHSNTLKPPNTHHQAQHESCTRTSGLDLPYAHVHHHGPRRVVGVDQRGEVAAVDLADVSQAGSAVVGHQRGALPVDVQAAVCRDTAATVLSLAAQWGHQAVCVCVQHTHLVYRGFCSCKYTMVICLFFVFSGWLGCAAVCFGLAEER